jgi:hypothetical protein
MLPERGAFQPEESIDVAATSTTSHNHGQTQQHDHSLGEDDIDEDGLDEYMLEDDERSASAASISLSEYRHRHAIRFPAPRRPHTRSSDHLPPLTSVAS